IFLFVIGAHRPAEDDGAGVLLQRIGQGFTKRRAADVEGKAAPDEHLADTARGRSFLVQDDQDRLAGGHVAPFNRASTRWRNKTRSRRSTWMSSAIRQTT